MLTRKDINEFKAIGYNIIAFTISNLPEPGVLTILSVAIFIMLGIVCAFRKD